jgi:nucleotide-binding universal stress UspA family protein
MKLLETILVPTVFGPGSDAAVRTAETLASVFDSKILILHVVPQNVHQLIAESPGIPELERRLRERHQRADSAARHDVEVVIDTGSTAAKICEIAALRNADLIVLGARSSSVGPDAGLGATAERVVRKAAAPVWIARTDAPVTPQHILCPVDGSDASRRALRSAHHLSRRLRAKLTVLNILEPMPSLYSGMVILGNGAETRFVSPQRQKFEKFLGDLDFRDESWIKKTRSGRPHEEILAEVSESHIDLLVMGTVGKTSVARFLIGSVTEKVMRRFPCSMLTMKAQEMIRLRLEVDLASLDECLCRGGGLLENGFAAEAIREFDRCLVVSPTLAAAWDGKARAYEQLGDASGATQARENAKRIRERLLRVLPGAK